MCHTEKQNLLALVPNEPVLKRLVPVLVMADHEDDAVICAVLHSVIDHKLLRWGTLRLVDENSHQLPGALDRVVTDLVRLVHVTAES